MRLILVDLVGFFSIYSLSRYLVTTREYSQGFGLLGFTYSLELVARVADWVFLSISLANSASSLALLFVLDIVWPSGLRT